MYAPYCPAKDEIKASMSVKVKSPDKEKLISDKFNKDLVGDEVEPDIKLDDATKAHTNN